MLLTRSRSVTSCSCPKYSSPISVEYPIQLPKIMCVVDGNLLVGCNANFFFFFDDQIKYVKRICLLEALESSNAASKHNQRRHSTMVKKEELKLEVSAICVDRLHMNQFRVYLLLNVLREVSILNVFRLDLAEFNRQASRASVRQNF